MKLLLDTHAIVWVMNDSPRLGKAVRAAVVSPRNSVFLSAASIWEAATRFRLGKFPQAAVLVDNPRRVVEALELEMLDITVDHARLAGSLVNPHKDPFDRMLAAQALLESLTLASLDPVFDSFHVSRMW
jgi:PIN domain nuclease of toxin-antitoxin system